MSLLPAPSSVRPLGRSDISVSALAWGMWRFAGSEADATRVVHAALDSGITFFDTADIYGFDGQGGFGDAEALLGRVMAADRTVRDRIVLATKGGILPPLPYDSSAKYLTRAIDASLARLGVDRIDLWQIHRPDILTHPEEVARALGDALDSGRVAAVGVSNMTVSQIATLQQFLDAPIVSTQPEMSPLTITSFTNGELDQAMAMDMAVMAWSPLGGGRIAEPVSDRELKVAAELDRVATQFAVGRTATAYSWLMAHPAGIIPIIGSQNPARIAEAVDAFKVRWTRQDWYAVLVASRGERLP